MAVSEGSGFSSISRLSSISSLSRFHGKSGISWYILPPVPQKAGFHFALLSPCTPLLREGRLRLGRENESFLTFILLFSRLALLCCAKVGFGSAEKMKVF